MRSTPDRLAQRRTRFERALGTHGLAAAVVSVGADLTYLLGESHSSFERLTALVVVPGSPVRLVVPLTEAAAWHRAADRDDVELVPYRDGAAPHLLVADLLGEAATVGVTATMPARHLLALQEARRGCTTYRLDSALRAVRSVKDVAEVSALRQAAAAMDQVHQSVPELLRPGRAESDIADDIRGRMVAAGFAEPDFVCVASGPSGGDPHHASSRRRLERGDVVFVDLSGAQPSGYFADCTRTYALGAPSFPDAERIFDAVAQAFWAASEAVRPGVRAGEVDAAARSLLTEQGLGDAFTHRTGHGIGLEVHEAPEVGPSSDDVLEVGMTFSVEPGAYLAGRFGARIEDIVVVTEQGCEHLNRSPRELVIV